MTDDLRSSEISEGLATRELGRPILVYDELASTNDEALRLADDGALHGTLVVAGRQTAGRGQRGRTWHSPGGGKGIYASLVLRGNTPLATPTLVVAAVGLGLAEGLEKATGVAVELKWPNDLWSGGRKLGGVLVESRGFRPEHPLFVAGFGINLNQREADFPEALRGAATSVALRTGKAHRRDVVVRELLTALELRVEQALAGSGADLQQPYRVYSMLRGRRVALLDGDKSREGLVADLSATEGLLLRLDDGTHVHVRAEHARDVRPL